MKKFFQIVRVGWALVQAVLIFPILPLYAVREIVASKKHSRLHKIVGVLFVSATLLPLWMAVYAFFGYAIANRAGLVNKSINIAGTGSMYPTFPKGVGNDPKELAQQIVDTPGMLPYPNGITLFGKRYFNHRLARGDIVVVENEKIRSITKELHGEETGMVKRVIAVPGDTLEIRDGIVILNGIQQKEPYIARARSTFGGEFLRDCQTLTVPPDKYFIMGDNRKGSGDSRHEVGLVDEGDIEFVVPWENQKGVLDKNWHDPAGDLDDTARITLNSTAFINLLNEKRKELGVTALTHNAKLDASAAKRGETVLKYDDFSFEATRSGYSMPRAVGEAGYSNILYGEWSILGQYDAEELIENLFEFPDGKKFLTNKEYDDIGVAPIHGSLNGCPADVVVIHFGGYVPPNYSKEVVNSWKDALTGLREVKEGWGKLKTFDWFYPKHREEVDRINELIDIRIRNIEGLVAKMDANQWLDRQQEEYVKKDPGIQDEINALAKKLNSYQ